MWVCWGGGEVCACVCVTAAGGKKKTGVSACGCVNRTSYYNKVNACVVMCRGKVRETAISQSRADTLRGG